MTKRVHFAAASQRTFRSGLDGPILLRGMRRRKWNMASEQRTELPDSRQIYRQRISVKERSKAATGSACYSG
nr:hypothetical protein [uncultured Acetatifactor sp.]